MSPAQLEAVPEVVKDRWTGQTRVIHIRLTIEDDSTGEAAVFVTITLSDPPAGQDGWPIDDIWTLRTLVQEAVSEQAPDISMPWFVRFVPEHEEVGDEDALL